jgi:hypothetical protein
MICLRSVAPELHPAAIADLVCRLEDAAELCAWVYPEARTTEISMTLDLVRMRALEAAVMIGDLAEELSARSQQAA